MNNNLLLENYSKGLSSTGKTRTLFLRFAREFLAYSDGDFSREKISSYMDHLRKQHSYRDGSVNFAFRVIRTMFNRNETILKAEGYEWPFRRGESPSIREDKVEAPALHPITIGKAIAAVKADGSPEEKAFLALSSTYGLRRVEMVELEASDIRLKDRNIHIATAKHGRERTHLIPEAIIPYLSGYDFNQVRSENFLFTLWYRIEIRIGLAHTHKVGWHSIRRSLNTILLRRLSEATVMSYLRWKQRTSSHMPFRYSAIKFVGEEGESTEVVGDALDVDNQVFEVHPFLDFWR
jgi:integrase